MDAKRHVVWDWNGTLLDDLALVVSATNAALASVGGPAITADQHRRDFRRPISDYYAEVLGRPVDEEEFARLDSIFHQTYLLGLPECELVTDAVDALRACSGSQSLLSLWFHDVLVPTVEGYGLTELFARIDGLREPLGSAVLNKGPHLAEHLTSMGLDGERVVLVGDTVDDAHAAAAVGAGCVLYTGGFSHPELLQATGAPVADTLVDAVALASTA